MKMSVRQVAPMGVVRTSAQFVVEAPSLDFGEVTRLVGTEPTDIRRGTRSLAGGEGRVDRWLWRPSLGLPLWSRQSVWEEELTPLFCETLEARAERIRQYCGQLGARARFDFVKTLSRKDNPGFGVDWHFVALAAGLDAPFSYTVRRAGPLGRLATAWVAAARRFGTRGRMVKTVAEFDLLSDLLDYPEVNRLLGLEPTRISPRGEPVTPVGEAPIRRWDRWSFDVSDPAGPDGEPSQDAGVALEALLAALSPRAEVMVRYCETHQVDASLGLWIESETLRLPAMIVPPELSVLAARLGTSIGFDIYTSYGSVSWR
jgi:hypothetical protein